MPLKAPPSPSFHSIIDATIEFHHPTSLIPTPWLYYLKHISFLFLLPPFSRKNNKVTNPSPLGICNAINNQWQTPPKKKLINLQTHQTLITHIYTKQSTSPESIWPQNPPRKIFLRILDNLDPPINLFPFFSLSLCFPSFFNIIPALIRCLLCHHSPISSYLIFSFYKMMTMRMKMKMEMQMSHRTSFSLGLLLLASVRLLGISSYHCQAQDLALTDSSC